jgi:hypothetical protein
VADDFYRTIIFTSFSLFISFALQKKMNMRRVVSTFMVTVVIIVSLNAQEYKTGIGIRAGTSSGLTIKHFVGPKAAFEGLLTTKWDGFDMTGLYEVHNRAFDVEHLNWYYGVGGHLGFWNGNHVYWGEPGYTYAVIGVVGILGIEYSFSEVPVNIGLDWKPVLNLIGEQGLWGDEAAISIRYIF